MIIEKFIAPGGDNYNYLLICPETREAAVIDPLASNEILEIIRKNKYKVKYILNTHSHGDHTGGNTEVKKKTDALVVAHKGVEGVDKFIKDGDLLSLGKLKIKSIYTPGHTFDSMCFLIGNKLFTGDTVFLGGAGNCRSGDVKSLYDSFLKKIINLPNETKLYAGHEYARRNLEFALNIEPDNKYIKNKLKEVKNKQMNLSTIAEEKQYNPFFRFNDKGYQTSLENKFGIVLNNQKDVFLKTREWRNNW